MKTLFIKISNFNNSKPGIITGIVIAALMILMGIACLIINIGRKEYFLIFLSALILAQGIFGLIKESKKMSRLKREQLY